MANPSITYTFSNGTAADASEVNTNFTDLVNALTDGTKSLSIDALTVAGAGTFNGNVTLGNASGDDITMTGSLASSIAIKTDSTYDIGTSSVKLQNIYSDAVNFGQDDLAYYDYQELDFSADSNFSAGTGRIVRVGAAIIFTWSNLTHSSNSSISTAAAIIPSAFRPAHDVFNNYVISGTDIKRVRIFSTGIVNFDYVDEALASSADTETNQGCACWVIDQ